MRVVKIIRLLDERLEHRVIERRVERDEFRDERRNGLAQIALGLVEVLEHGGLQNALVIAAVDERGGNFVDVLAVLHEPRNEHADIVQLQFADDGGEEGDEFAVGFFAILHAAFEELLERLVLLLETEVRRLKLRDAQGQVVPFVLHLGNGHHGDCVFLRLGHGANVTGGKILAIPFFRVAQAFQPAGGRDIPVPCSNWRLESRQHPQTRMSALRTHRRFSQAPAARHICRTIIQNHFQPRRGGISFDREPRERKNPRSRILGVSRWLRFYSPVDVAPERSLQHF